MGIGVKETQDIIRQAAVLSRNEPSVPARLDPQEAGMATGPRQRRRALLRPGAAPDYIRPIEREADEWQRLDDDIYKFLHLRRDQFGRLGDPPSHQFIAEMEAQLRFADPGYELGTYLGLLRLAADLDQTRQTFVTASEKGAFQAFARRLIEGRKAGEAYDPEMVKRYLDLIDENDPAAYRALADCFRLVARAARQPLLAGMREAPSLSIAVLLQVVDIATRFNRRTEGRLEFRAGPVDVFLGARSVLYNRSVTQPTLSMVKELVLDETGLYHEDLMEWLQNVGLFGSEMTLRMPASLTEEGFPLQGERLSAVEMVMAAGERMARVPALAGRALQTLSDAMLFKIQQQDTHKDTQVQGILGHFHRLLRGERRSAQRVNEERQQVRFDYVSAIQRAGELVKEIQTGQFRAAQPGAPLRAYLPSPEAEASPLETVVLSPRSIAPAFPASAPAHRSAAASPGALSGASSAAAAAPAMPALQAKFDEAPAPAIPASVSAAYAAEAAAAAVTSAAAAAEPPSRPGYEAPAAILAGLLPREYERLLGQWDGLVGRIRKKLSAKSQAYKTLAGQLARARALDTCLVYGVTPAGARLTSRLGRLLQGEAVRARLGMDGDAAEALEDAFSLGYPRFLASMESLILAVYGFRPDPEGVHFRLRDRAGSRPAGEARPEPAGPPDPSLSPELRARAASAAHGSGQGDRPADSRKTVIWTEGADLDEALIRLLVGAILLGRDAETERSAAQSREYAPTPEHRFHPDGRLRFPAGGPGDLGAGDPFLAFCALLWVGRESQDLRASDPESCLQFLVRLSPEQRASLFRRYRELAAAEAEPAAAETAPGAESMPRSPSSLILRSSFATGFEMGFMGEIRHAFENSQGGSGLDSMLMAHLAALKPELDRAGEILADAKSRLARGRLLRALG